MTHPPNPIPPLLAVANWKMNTTVQQAITLASEIRRRLEPNPPSNVQTVLCPPFISLHPLHDLLKNTNIALGAQNLHPQPSGAFTGEISPTMLQGLCQYVIVGHSERRHLMREGYHVVGQKMKAAVDAGLIPILCVGETLSQRRQGAAESVVRRQLETALSDIDNPRSIVIAYEPVWAIGTGVPATPVVVADITGGAIPAELANLYDAQTARAIPVLYGGSVNPENVTAFMEQPSIRGVLVGGASLHPAQFAQIVQLTAQSKAVN